MVIWVEFRRECLHTTCNENSEVWHILNFDYQDVAEQNHRVLVLETLAVSEQLLVETLDVVVSDCRAFD